jgi:hypothetical protein
MTQLSPSQLFVCISTISAKKAVELIQQTKKEWERNNILYVLEKYNTWLLKEGYTDTDIIYELNINEFLETLKKEDNDTNNKQP